MPARTLDDTNFVTTITSTALPVLIDFTASWCGPCKQLGPIVDKLADEVGFGAVVAKIDIDRAPRAAATCRVRSVPTIVVFSKGQEINRVTGVQSIEQLRALLRG